MLQIMSATKCCDPFLQLYPTCLPLSPGCVRGSSRMKLETWEMGIGRHFCSLLSILNFFLLASLLLPVQQACHICFLLEGMGVVLGTICCKNKKTEVNMAIYTHRWTPVDYLNLQTTCQFNLMIKNNLKHSDFAKYLYSRQAIITKTLPF